MMTRTRLRTTALAAAVMLGASAVLTLPAAATPSSPTGPATGAWVSTGAGYSGVINVDADANLESAVIQNIRIEGGDTVGTFCIDAPTEFVTDSGVVYTSNTRSSTSKPNLARAAHLATSSASIGTPLADTNAEATAVQVAIWVLTDAADYSTVANATIQARVAELLADTTTAPERPSSFILDMTSTALSGTEVRLDITFRTNTGDEQANQPVAVTFPGGSQTVTTNASGDASLTIPAPETVGAATATWSGVLPGGSVVEPPVGQDVITVADADITRSATAPVPAADVTVPTTTPPTTTPGTPSAPTTAPPTGGGPSTPAASPSPATPADELPYTGTFISPVTGAALAAGLLGLGLALRRRARRS